MHLCCLITNCYFQVLVIIYVSFSKWFCKIYKERDVSRGQWRKLSFLLRAVSIECTKSLYINKLLVKRNYFHKKFDLCNVNRTQYVNLPLFTYNFCWFFSIIHIVIICITLKYLKFYICQFTWACLINTVFKSRNTSCFLEMILQEKCLIKIYHCYPIFTF